MMNTKDKNKGFEAKVEDEIANLDYKDALPFPSLLTTHKEYLLEKIDKLTETDANIYRGTHSISKKLQVRVIENCHGKMFTIFNVDGKALVSSIPLDYFIMEG